MKKLSTVLLMYLLVCFESSFAQEAKKHTHKNRLSIGVVASPDLYIYDFKQNGLTKPSYNAKLNYSVGGTVIYHPIKFITLRGSLLYSQKGYTVNYAADANQPTLPTSKDYQVNYLDIPLMLNMNLIHKDHIHLFISGGFVPSILLNKAVDYNTSANGLSKTGDLNNINNFFAGVSYSIGVKYNLTEWLGAGFEPYFRTSLNKVDDAMNGKPVSFGGKVSFVINFNHY